MSLGVTDDDPFGDQTSGDTSFRLLAIDLLNEAYSILQMGTEGEDLTPEMFAQGFRTMNMMVATWQAQGIHLWSYDDATLFLEAGKESYVLENSNCTNRFLETTSTTATTISGTTIDLTSVDELFDDWFIGFLTPTGSIFWTTVATSGITGNTVTVNDAFTEVLPIGTTVFYYETKVRPVERVLGLRRASLVGNDVPINLISRQEYFDLPSKKSVGLAAEGYYSRELPRGILYLWQVPENSCSLIKVEYERKLEDFVNNDDCPDFPKYWMEALAYNLAKRLAIKYRIPPIIKQDVDLMAMETLNQALNFDQEVTDISISLNREVR